MKILFIGDLVGRPGRQAFSKWTPKIKEEFDIDFVVVNAENAAGGLGVTPEILDELFSEGVHAVTLGNHTWRKKTIIPVLDNYPRVVRPANYPKGVPGQGRAVVRNERGQKLGVTNVLGRIFMEAFDCPFEAARREVEAMRAETNTILVDVHAEATSEKVALGWYLDGKCTAVVGTHTHVQTADERILPQGAAYITDVGMTGPRDSVIGVERENVIHRFLTGLPTPFDVSKERAIYCGVVIETDDATGKAINITRIMK